MKIFKKMLHSGADKVSVNSAAIKDPNLIKEGARLFGSQCIVLAVDARSEKIKMGGMSLFMVDELIQAWT